MDSEHIIFKPLSSLSRWERNYRVGDVPSIVASIVRFGFNGALKVWQGGRVMAGNHSLIALETMHANGAKPPRGITADGREWMVPCIDVGHLSETEAQAYAIADNRTQELGQNDPQRLAELLGELAKEQGGLDATGYNQNDLSALLRSIEAAGKQTLVDPGPQDSSSPEFGPIRPQPGQIWALGEHRLLCGDATSPTLVSKLFDGKRADLIFTDPPYGVAYVGKTDEALTIANDDLGDKGTRLLVRDLLKAAPLKRGGAFYVCSPSGPFEMPFRMALLDASLNLRQSIVWVKNQHVLSRADYHYKHEAILHGDSWAPEITPEEFMETFHPHGTLLYGWKDGAAHYFTDDRKKNTVWFFDKPPANKDHPTMKPLALVEEAVENSSRLGETVYDCCSGSGTTLIACERLSRVCRAAELLPRYCEVILRRWEDMTGRTAEPVP